MNSIGLQNAVGRDAERRIRHREEYLSRSAGLVGGLIGAVEAPSEARQALTYVLGSLDVGVSLEALERAIATIRKHLEA